MRVPLKLGTCFHLLAEQHTAAESTYSNPRSDQQHSLPKYIVGYS